MKVAVTLMVLVLVLFLVMSKFSRPESYDAGSFTRHMMERVEENSGMRPALNVDPPKMKTVHSRAKNIIKALCRGAAKQYQLSHFVHPGLGGLPSDHCEKLKSLSSTLSDGYKLTVTRSTEMTKEYGDVSFAHMTIVVKDKAGRDLHTFELQYSTKYDKFYITNELKDKDPDPATPGS